MVAQVGAAARAYGALTMASLRSSVQRPATLVVRGIGSALVALCEAVGVVLLVDRFGSIAGWRTPEIIVLAGLVFTGGTFHVAPFTLVHGGSSAAPGAEPPRLL